MSVSQQSLVFLKAAISLTTLSLGILPLAINDGDSRNDETEPQHAQVNCMTRFVSVLVRCVLLLYISYEYVRKHTLGRLS